MRAQATQGRLRLGEMLEQRGLLAHEMLLRALRNQKVLGGRLGTCLLEIDALSEETLTQALAEVQGAPSATPEELRGIPDEVIDLVPVKIASRCLAIPFHASSTQVQVAVADFRDLDVQDQVAFVVGKRIRWHVVPELRIYEALEKHYNVECPTRYAKLLDRLNRSRFLWSREAAAVNSPIPPGREAGELRWSLDGERGGIGSAPPVSTNELPAFAHQEHARFAELPDLPMTTRSTTKPPSAGSSSIDSSPVDPRFAKTGEVSAAEIGEAVGTVSTVEADAAASNDETNDPAEERSPAGRLSVAEAERRLLNPMDRDEVARVAVDFAAGRSRRAALLVVRKQEIAAWRWAGEGLDGPRLAAYRSTFREPSIFVGLRDGAGIFRGTLPPMPAHLNLLAAFDPDAAKAEFTALPIRVRTRLVAVLLLESPAEKLSPTDLEELRRVVAKTAIAFELCIMRAKLRDA